MGNRVETHNIEVAFLVSTGILLFMLSWIHNVLPSWLMQLIAWAFHASPTGGR